MKVESAKLAHYSAAEHSSAKLSSQQNYWNVLHVVKINIRIDATHTRLCRYTSICPTFYTAIMKHSWKLKIEYCNILYLKCTVERLHTAKNKLNKHSWEVTRLSTATYSFRRADFRLSSFSPLVCCSFSSSDASLWRSMSFSHWRTQQKSQC